MHSDDVLEARAGHVEAVFARLSTRPGTRLEWAGDAVWFTDTRTVDRLDGQVRSMRWEDGPAGDTITAAINAADVDLDGLTAACLRAAVAAIVNSDLHELTEWFCLDGEPVWDPHPNGRRFDDTAHVTHGVRFSGDTPTAVHGEPGEWCEIPAAAARRVAAELAEAVTVGVHGAFSVADDLLVHTAQYPDRVTGELSEFTWCREILGDLCVPDGVNTAAALRATLLAEMYCTAAQSLTHEVAEWLTLDGQRPFDPHPGPHRQIEQLWPTIEFHTSPLTRP